MNLEIVVLVVIAVELALIYTKIKQGGESK